jgi:hypothetical protein
MKTIPLRQLLREPLKVKRWTRAGQTVHVTDDGEPLWTIQAAVIAGDDETRRKEINDLLDELLQQPKSPLSLSRIIKESRR